MYKSENHEIGKRIHPLLIIVSTFQLSPRFHFPDSIHVSPASLFPFSCCHDPVSVFTEINNVIAPPIITSVMEAMFLRQHSASPCQSTIVAALSSFQSSIFLQTNKHQYEFFFPYNKLTSVSNSILNTTTES